MVLASLSSSDVTSILNLAQYGILGLVVVALVRGYLVPGYVLERREKELDARDQKIESMSKVFEERALPAMLKGNDVLERALALLNEMDTERRIAREAELRGLAERRQHAAELRRTKGSR